MPSALLVPQTFQFAAVRHILFVPQTVSLRPLDIVAGTRRVPSALDAFRKRLFYLYRKLSSLRPLDINERKRGSFLSESRMT